MPIKLIQHDQPSYKAGYAKSASESAYPSLWDGMVSAWMPSMGPTGGTLHDIAGSTDLSTVNMDVSSNWKDNYLDFNADDEHCISSGYVSFGVALSFSCLLFQDSTDIKQTPLGIENATSPDLLLTIDPQAGEMNFYSNLYAGASETFPSPATGWHHYCWTRDRTNTISYFRDGVQIGSASRSGTGSGPLYLGSCPKLASYGFGLASGLHSALFHNRCLDPREVMQLHVDPLAPFRQRKSIPFGVTEAPESPTVHRSPSILQTNIIKPSLEVDFDDPLNKGLVAWWPMARATGDKLVDVANGLHGTVHSDQASSEKWVTTSKDNGLLALDFDGAWDYADLSGVDSGGTSWTFSVSYNRTIGQQRLLDFYDAGSGDRVIIDMLGSPSSIRIYDGAWQVSSGNTPAYGIWNYLTVTSDGSVYRVYFDGNYNGQVNAGTARSIRGVGALGSRWDGTTDFATAKFSDARIYNRALSPNEVHDLYVASRTGYVDQYKRRSFSIAATPTMLERIRSRSKPAGTAKTITIKHNETPSYKAGYAKSASESAYPELWDGLFAAYIPRLGETNQLHDVLGGPSAVSVDGATWSHQNGSVIHCDADDESFDATRTDVPVLGTTGFCWYRPFADTPNEINFVSTGPDASSGYRVFLTGGVGTDGTPTNAYIRTEKSAGTYVGGYNSDSSGHGVQGEWNWIAWRIPQDAVDVSDLSLIVNGKELTLTSNPNVPYQTAGKLRIGSSGFARNSNCDFGAVMIWDRYVPTSELIELGADPLAPFRRKTLTMVHQPTKDLRGLIRIS